MKTLTIYNNISEAKNHVKNFESQLIACHLEAHYDTIIDRNAYEIEEFLMENFGLKYDKNINPQIEPPNEHGHYKINVSMNLDSYGLYNQNSKLAIHTKEEITKELIRFIGTLIDNEKDFAYCYNLAEDQTKHCDLVLYSINGELKFCYDDTATILGEYLM